MQKTKFCFKCKKEISLEDFYKHKGHKDGLMSSCKKCTNKTNKYNYKKYKDKRLEWAKQYRLGHKEELKKWGKDWYKKNKDRVKNYALMQKYGITLDDYNTIFMEQSGCCIICGKHQSEMAHALAVDHSHKSGQVRGLLCDGCNVVLGYVNDDISILKRMVSYLEKYESI